MRTPRFLAPWKDEVGGKPALYHCLSRVVERRYVFKRVEKEQFVALMRKYERFCGVRIITHCVMSNHFHLLVEVPPLVDEELSDEDLFSRMAAVYPEREVARLRAHLTVARAANDLARVQDLRERYTYRMGNLSEFMKVLLQTFTQWFNRRHGRKGTLWEERYKSVLVEDGYTARVTAAYIDLNPVRAGLVKDPKDYRWCGYAAALAGDGEAMAGIRRMMVEFEKSATGVVRGRSLKNLLADYRVILFEDGEEVHSQSDEGDVAVARKGMSPRQVEKVRREGGLLGRHQLLRHRARTFVDGVVLGSQGFVEEVIAANAPGRERRREPRALPGSALPLCSLRGV